MENVVKIDDRLAVAKFAPAADALKEAAEEGFKSVVNMRTANEKQDVTPEEERKHAEAAGLTYLHHPVDGRSSRRRSSTASAKRPRPCPARCWCTAPPASDRAQW